jgi:pimeloyl-ACP methyl ester carboxylesterase
MLSIRTAVASFMLAGFTQAKERVSFPTEDGGLIYADLYGKGDRAIVLAHGARFNKESWAKQIPPLEEAGFRVLAIDFRGYGESRAGSQASGGYGDLYLDVLAAVRYLHQAGAKSVAVMGGSMGAGAAEQAAEGAKPGEIDRLVLLAPAWVKHPEKLSGRKLFVTSRGDSLAEQIQEEYKRVPEPKRLLLFDGSAHAQFLFETEQGGRLMEEILRFLNEP